MSMIYSSIKYYIQTSRILPTNNNSYSVTSNVHRDTFSFDRKTAIPACCVARCANTLAKSLCTVRQILLVSEFSTNNPSRLNSIGLCRVHSAVDYITVWEWCRAVWSRWTSSSRLSGRTKTNWLRHSRKPNPYASGTLWLGRMWPTAPHCPVLLVEYSQSRHDTNHECHERDISCGMHASCHRAIVGSPQRCRSVCTIVVVFWPEKTGCRHTSQRNPPGRPRSRTTTLIHDRSHNWSSPAILLYRICPICEWDGVLNVRDADMRLRLTVTHSTWIGSRALAPSLSANHANHRAEPLE